ncbi:MAG: hypothetical protein JWP74_3493 [Marmoricola sp.]|nr:hypothetical protein [Marmoricola sp.]
MTTDLLAAMAAHMKEPFPSIEKGGYGEVDCVLIDADIYGYGLMASEGDLTGIHRARLQKARDKLDRSINAFPAEARPYYLLVLRIADLALDADHAL